MTGQALLMRMAGEVCALDAHCVREILDPTPAVRVPGAKPYLANVVNVRGKVIPLADLGERLGGGPALMTPDSRFVVIEIELFGRPESVAVVADKVFDVIELTAADYQKAPCVGAPWREEFIAGFARWRDDYVILPDMIKIISGAPH